MFGIFRSNPVKKAQKQYQNKLAEAMKAQRAGNIQEYARLSAEAEEQFKELERLKKDKKS